MSKRVPQAISSSIRRGASQITRFTTSGRKRAAAWRISHEIVIKVILRIDHAGDAAFAVLCVLLEFCRLSLVIIRTERLGSALNAARMPASPPPMIKRSVKKCGTRFGLKGTRYRGV